MRRVYLDHNATNRWPEVLAAMLPITRRIRQRQLDPHVRAARAGSVEEARESWLHCWEADRGNHVLERGTESKQSRHFASLVQFRGRKHVIHPRLKHSRYWTRAGRSKNAGSP